MTAALVFDVALAFALVWCGWQALHGAPLARALIMFIVFGLMMALAYARLSAPDLGLAEAAVGAGLTGALLLHTYGALRRRRRSTTP